MAQRQQVTWSELRVGLFVLVTGAAAASFYSQIRELRWRARALAGLLASLVLVVGYYAFA